MHLQNSITAAKSNKFATKPTIYSPHPNYVVALPWETENSEILHFRARKTCCKCYLMLIMYTLTLRQHSARPSCAVITVVNISNNWYIALFIKQLKYVTKVNTMKREPDLSAFHVIQPGNTSDLVYSSRGLHGSAAVLYYPLSSAEHRKH